MIRSTTIPLAWMALVLISVAGAVRGGEVDFNRDIRKILSDKCFKCHGPDPKTQEAGLRLDAFEAATGVAKSGRRPIVPGDPERSEIIRRIFSDDPGERMPPPETKNPLSDEQKAILRRWVEQGAKYKPHWSFIAPLRSLPPRVRDDSGVLNAIDRFVEARFVSAGLQPNAEADRYTLIRRVHLDLTGLPPTPEAVDRILRDAAPDWYERLVDRLLDSSAYGERWARPWLDLARYADTNGYEKDRPRTMWPYRDWVISALNADVPFDRFTIEQIAGDMLPGATQDQIIATGFHRNTMVNEEGGIDPMEFRFHAQVDRVGTTGTVWLGLTVACSQCHTHKFDPLMHDEFYSMMAFFDQADDVPKVAVIDPETAAKRAEIEHAIAQKLADLYRRFPEGVDADEQFKAWVAKTSSRAVRWEEIEPTEMRTELAYMDLLPDGSVLVSGDQSKLDVYDLTYLLPGNRRITGLRLEAMPHHSLPEGGPGRVNYEGPLGDFFLSDMTVLADGAKIRFDKADQDFATMKGFGAVQPNLAAGVVDDSTETGWSINGGQGVEHRAVFTFAEPTEEADRLDIKMTFERWYAAALGRFRVSITLDMIDEPHADLPADVEAILAAPEAERSSSDVARLWRHFLSIAPELEPARKEIVELRKKLPAFPTTLVLDQRPSARYRDTKRHNRGEYLKAAESVEPGVPKVLHSLPAETRRDRLAFARWLVDERNPLVARVTVNRHWASLFGTGLVKTVDDFGLQGDPPSHPELLDYLAVEFMRSGWSMKRLHRMIVTSATYRRSSVARPEQHRIDPENRLLARAPRFRMEAEMVRDNALAASGLMTHKIGGPSVFPPQPPGITEGTYGGGLQWATDTGADRYRRGLYTFAKRTAPFAMANLFGAPSGEQCEPRRVRSNTPLQALTLLNDTVFVEAAQALGAEIAALDGNDEQRAIYLMRCVLTRPPSEDEMHDVLAFHAVQLERFRAEPSLAGQICGQEGAIPERAAWTAVARAVLNLDEAITRE